MLGLRDCVGHNDLVEGAGVDAINGVSAENAMRDERVDLGSTLFLQELRGTCDCVRSICQIVDKDRCSVRNVSNQHHGGVLPIADLCGAAFFVDERKGHAECIGNGRGTLSTSSVRADYDGLLVVGDVVLDVLSQKMTAVQVVHGDVEEALVLRI